MSHAPTTSLDGFHATRFTLEEWMDAAVAMGEHIGVHQLMLFHTAAYGDVVLDWCRKQI